MLVSVLMSIFLCVSSLEDDSSSLYQPKSYDLHHSKRLIQPTETDRFNYKSMAGKEVALSISDGWAVWILRYTCCWGFLRFNHLQLLQNDIVGDGVHQPNIWMFPKIEVPKNGWFIILPLFSETPIWGFICPRYRSGSGWRVIQDLCIGCFWRIFC